MKGQSKEHSGGFGRARQLERLEMTTAEEVERARQQSAPEPESTQLIGRWRGCRAGRVCSRVDGVTRQSWRSSPIGRATWLHLLRRR